jgi:predicted acylesterase/phospholipase RssA
MVSGEGLLGNPNARIGLVLSGGGFRATFFHLGVIKALAESGLLSQVRVLTAVSGGSIMAAHLAVNWARYSASHISFNNAAQDLCELGRSDLRGRVFRASLASRVAGIGLLFPSAFSSTTFLLREYDSFFGRSNLGILGPDREQIYKPAFHLLATSLTTGKQYSFSQQGLWIDHQCAENALLPLSLAVAASSAFPPLFPPVTITRQMLHLQRPETFGLDRDHLADGGLHDNLGLRHLLLIKDKFKLDRILVSDASAPFDWVTATDFSSILSRTIRSTDILMKRVADLEETTQNLQLSADGTNVSYLRIHSVVGSPPERSLQASVANIRTDLDKFSDVEINALAAHGYRVARSGLSLGVAKDDYNPSTQTPPSVDQLESILRASRVVRYRFLRMSDLSSWLMILLVFLYGSIGWNSYTESKRKNSRMAFEAGEATAVEKLNALPINCTRVDENGACLECRLPLRYQNMQAATHELWCPKMRAGPADFGWNYTVEIGSSCTGAHCGKVDGNITMFAQDRVLAGPFQFISQDDARLLRIKGQVNIPANEKIKIAIHVRQIFTSKTPSTKAYTKASFVGTNDEITLSLRE